jgi:hypothetical protein
MVACRFACKVRGSVGTNFREFRHERDVLLGEEVAKRLRALPGAADICICNYDPPEGGFPRSQKHDRVAGPNTLTTRSIGLREPGTIVCRR